MLEVSNEFVWFAGYQGPYMPGQPIFIQVRGFQNKKHKDILWPYLWALPYCIEVIALWLLHIEDIALKLLH